MKRRAALEAALIWLIILCSIQAVAARHGLGGDGGLAMPMLALVSALAVGLTYGVAVSPLLPATGYIVAHLAGVVVVVAALEWPAPPWPGMPCRGWAGCSRGPSAPSTRRRLPCSPAACPGSWPTPVPGWWCASAASGWPWA